MEALRWILLGAGVFFVFIIYLLGRERRPHSFDSNEAHAEELPEFSANNWNDADDDIVDVHISARQTDEVYSNLENGDIEASDEISNDLSDGEQVFDESEEQLNTENETENIIVLTLIARAEEGLHGDKINSAALANNLKYGYMEIFHRIGKNAKPQFSVANMIEPGSFDPVTIHELRTPGLTFFMQLPVYGDALDAFTDMLQCAYQLSELLDADLCNQHRKPLTESEAESLRTLVKRYVSE